MEMNLKSQNEFNQTLIADAQKQFQAIKKRGIIKDKEPAGKLAIQFADSDRFIEAISSEIEREAPEVRDYWKGMVAEHYADRDAGKHDRADLGEREMKQALLPMLEIQFSKKLLELKADLEATENQAERDRISLEIEDHKINWSGIRRNLKR